MNKVVCKEDIKGIFKDGMTIMIGGFLGCGSPMKIIDLIAELGIKDITVISNDTCFINQGVGKLLTTGQVKKLIASYIGGNADTGRLMNEGSLEVELCPQGTLAERIRSGGAGLGGVLTPTGVATRVEEGKEKLIVDGKEYILEKPLKADLAIIKGNIIDEAGNVYYKGNTRNFNTVMALAGETVIAEADEIVKCGELQPELVMTPGVVVDYIVKSWED